MVIRDKVYIQRGTGNLELALMSSKSILKLIFITSDKVYAGKFHTPILKTERCLDVGLIIQDNLD